MNSAGMVFHSILGYVFQRKGDGISYIADKEQLWGLHRFYNPSTGDHRYTIDPKTIQDLRGSHGTGLDTVSLRRSLMI